MNKHAITESERGQLLKTTLLTGLQGRSLQRMLDSAIVEEREGRSSVFRQGENADAFYCVLNGYVRLFRLSREGRHADVRICQPGDVFAECMIYGGGDYTFNAQTADTATLARFDLGTVRRLAEEDTNIARAVMTCLSQHLIDTMHCVGSDRLNTAPQRVADYLLERCPIDRGPASVQLPFQKNLLAGMLGLAPEALSRAFSTLRPRGVTVRGRMIQIGDVQALREVV
ncbi:helix-turn-helix domain-containing protein [Rhizobiales bacterium RZME27]|jgi:CRP-like cAMP-binding protein|uniref:Helix-turn-helix domain-containing protein n=1 Tax=Endobacterium cereale TaxID=2663029 RepID=A0A6A8AEX2_9HYPH|nr:Crp/Fnr family transcriptional regulator [Endobacterium cereale]MEB2842857.1 Crp/Fnr family transcriptional regulator [Endobacterium cereale]MQY49883.1 helix-turn-helix domain-containing protein [Endobacterium cereale]